MKIKHEHIESVLFALAAEKGQAWVANAITEEYLRQGGGELPLVPGKDWNNQQNIYHRWLKGETKTQREKIQKLIPAILAILPRELRHRLCIFDNGEEWVHLRIEEDLASVREKLTKKSAAGKASVQARRSRKEADVQTKQERNLTGVQTDVEVVFEHDVNTKATNKDTDKDLKTDPPLNPPRGNRGVKKFDPLDIALPNWISVSLWREWVEFRQALRKPIRTEQGATCANQLVGNTRQP